MNPIFIRNPENPWTRYRPNGERIQLVEKKAFAPCGVSEGRPIGVGDVLRNQCLEIKPPENTRTDYEHEREWQVPIIWINDEVRRVKLEYTDIIEEEMGVKAHAE